MEGAGLIQVLHAVGFSDDTRRRFVLDCCDEDVPE